MSDDKHARSTMELDREHLARLAREAAGDDGSCTPTAPQGSGPQESIATSRTQTLQDPLTMALLAEVARSSRTEDFDPTALAAALEAERADAEPELPHPNLKRRS